MQVGDVLYMAFARPIWTLGVAILTFLCVTGEGGVVNSMLSWYIWDPIAKLTYVNHVAPHNCITLHLILIREHTTTTHQNTRTHQVQNTPQCPDVLEPIAPLTFPKPPSCNRYSAYLIHPFLIRVVYYNRTDLFTYSDTMYVTHILAFVMISYAVASGMALLIETPFARLEKVLLKKGD
jgi:hypothetical protein